MRICFVLILFVFISITQSLARDLTVFSIHADEVDDWISKLDHESEVTRKDAVRALLRAQDRRAVNPFNQRMLKESAPEVVYNLIHAANRFNDPRLVPGFLHMANSTYGPPDLSSLAFSLVQSIVDPRWPEPIAQRWVTSEILRSGNGLDLTRTYMIPRDSHSLSVLTRALQTSPHEIVRSNIAIALAYAQDPIHSYPPLFRTLKSDPSERVRDNAGFGIAQIKDPLTGPALVDSIKNEPSTEVRDTSAWALSFAQYPPAVPALMDVLRNDSSSMVKSTVVLTLGAYKAQEALPLILTFAKEAEGDELVYTIEGLRRLKNSASIPFLLSTAKENPDANARYVAVLALQAIADPSVFESLHALFTTETDLEIREIILAAIGTIGNKVKDFDTFEFLKTLREKDPTFMWSALKALIHLQDSRVEGYFLELLKKESNRGLVAALGDRKSKASVDTLIQILRESRAQDYSLTRVCIDALGKIGDLSAKEALFGILEADDRASGFPTLAAQAAKALVGMVGASDTKRILPLIEDRKIQEDAKRPLVLLVASIEDSSATEALLAYFKKPKHDIVWEEERRGWVGVALGARKDPRVYTALTTALSETSVDVRVGALLGLGHLKDPSVLAILKDQLHSNYNGRLRAAAAKALGTLGDKRALGALENATRDSFRDVRLNARAALQLLSSPKRFVGLKNDPCPLLVDSLGPDPFNRSKRPKVAFAEAKENRLHKLKRVIKHQPFNLVAVDGSSELSCEERVDDFHR